MRIYRYALGVAAVLLLSVAGAGAQDGGKTGITMGYPASIGVIWHANDKIAIRPEFSISGTSSESSPAPSFTSKTDGWGYGVGASALFYLHTYDHLRTYFSPRFTYGHATTNGESSGLATLPSGIATVTTKSTANTSGITGSFGAQYALGDKFSVFGEVGFGFNHSSTTTSSTAISQKVTGNGWGTRTGVGVIFYP